MDRSRQLDLTAAALAQQGFRAEDIRANAVFLDACAEKAVNVLRLSQGLRPVEIEKLSAEEQDLARAIARAVLSEANRQIEKGG